MAPASTSSANRFTGGKAVRPKLAVVAAVLVMVIALGAGGTVLYMQYQAAQEPEVTESAPQSRSISPDELKNAASQAGNGVGQLDTAMGELEGDINDKQGDLSE